MIKMLTTNGESIVDWTEISSIASSACSCDISSISIALITKYSFVSKLKLELILNFMIIDKLVYFKLSLLLIIFKF